VDILLYFVLPIALLALGLPVYVILLLTAGIGIAINPELPLHSMQTVVFGALDSFPLLAIPLFILAGDIMGQGGLATRLIAWVMSLIGGVRGSLALTAVASSTMFGAMSGSSVGCIAAIGRILYPALRSGGYSTAFSGGLIAATGAIDVLIPPSIPMIIYGIAGQQSVPALFLAGVLPGIMLAVAAALYVLFYARIRMVPLTAKVRWVNVITTTREASWSLGAPVVILGGIYGGVFTPTEAAGVAVIYAGLVARYVYHELSWKELWRVTVNSMYLCSQVLIIVAASGLYSWLVTTSGVPQRLVEGIQTYGLSIWQLLVAFNVLLLGVGSLVEPPAAILILTPLFLPVVQSAGIDPIHFGIIITMNLAIGMFTPPFGLNLFAVHALFRTPLPSLYRGVLPLLGLYLVVLMLITYVPWFSLAPLALLKTGLHP
jgi:C4-dicarboxylate transporter DctM subunit